MIQIVFTIIWFMKTENIIYYILKNHKQRSFSEVLVPHFNELIYKFLQKSPADAFNWGHLPHVFLQNDKKSDKSFEISIYHFICLLHTIFFTSFVLMYTSCKDSKISGWLLNFLPRACLVVIRNISMFLCWNKYLMWK